MRAIAAIALAGGLALVGGCAEDTIPQDDVSSPLDASEGASTSPGDGGGASAEAAPAIAYDAGRGIEAGMAASPDCDLNGRWLVAQRVLASALGQSQASHNWFYYELQQDGTRVTVTKGLHCGYEVKAISPLGADVDSQGAWPAFLAHDSDTGRQGTAQESSGMCQVTFEKRYTVRGATLPFYADPSQALPTVMQQASSSTPGWEDWDGDGHPGITLVVSGPATGSLYLTQRDWNQYAGATALDATSFELAVSWNTTQAPLGYQGSPLVTESATPDSDTSQHYVWFVRLAAGQAIGTDTAICASVRSLVPTLAPSANQ